MVRDCNEDRRLLRTVFHMHHPTVIRQQWEEWRESLKVADEGHIKFHEFAVPTIDTLADFWRGRVEVSVR